MVDNSCDDWDYADAARYLLERFHTLRAKHKRLCLISVGEVTVTLNRTPGAGGRNQQFALACALELAKHPGERLTVLSAGSDGIDGNTQSAGAIADPTTVARARAFGFDPEPSLADFNACPLFTALGDSVVTGPTGHNLRDLRLLIAEKVSLTSRRLCKRRHLRRVENRTQLFPFAADRSALGLVRGSKSKPQDSRQIARHSRRCRRGQGLHRHRLQNHQWLPAGQRAPEQARLAGHQAAQLPSQHPRAHAGLRPQPPSWHHRREHHQSVLS